MHAWRQRRDKRLSPADEARSSGLGGAEWAEGEVCVVSHLLAETREPSALTQAPLRSAPREGIDAPLLPRLLSDGSPSWYQCARADQARGRCRLYTSDNQCSDVARVECVEASKAVSTENWPLGLTKLFSSGAMGPVYYRLLLSVMTNEENAFVRIRFQLPHDWLALVNTLLWDPPSFSHEGENRLGFLEHDTLSVPIGYVDCERPKEASFS